MNILKVRMFLDESFHIPKPMDFEVGIVTRFGGRWWLIAEMQSSTGKPDKIVFCRPNAWFDPWQRAYFVGSSKTFRFRPYPVKMPATIFEECYCLLSERKPMSYPETRPYWVGPDGIPVED